MEKLKYVRLIAYSQCEKVWNFMHKAIYRIGCINLCALKLCALKSCPSSFELNPLFSIVHISSFPPKLKLHAARYRIFMSVRSAVCERRVCIIHFRYAFIHFNHASKWSVRA